jgi:hypothetical protein
MIKFLKELGIDSSYFNMIMAIYNKSITTIILNGRKLKARNKSGIKKLFLNQE